jgi:hypothetical protein
MAFFPVQKEQDQSNGAGKLAGQRADGLQVVAVTFGVGHTAAFERQKICWPPAADL